MTKKSNVKQLKNTFSKLNSLAGHQKEVTENNLSKTKSVINTSRMGYRMYAEREKLVQVD